MNLNILTPRKALNKAFLKIKAVRDEFENFRTHLIGLLDRIDENESEEFHKNLVSDFLRKSFYDPNHFINTKGHTDLVIHSGKDAQSPVAVIIETKKPGNKAEMLRSDNINVKAFQELVLYYLRERISGKNIEIRQVIATDIYEWFIFDANFFEKEFAQNRNLVSLFNEFEAGRLSGKTTDFFYREIAAPAIAGITSEISFAHFDIREYEEVLRNPSAENDSRLIDLFKIFSPEHLLKLPFANDSNSLDRNFYAELLHIIGVDETKDGNRKIIQRKKESERNTGFLIENTILRLDSLKRIQPPEKDDPSGETYEERLFSAGLELFITWINRVLFLKLLEAQLISYHKGDKSYAFLHIGKIKNFDALNCLFFQVLACRKEERDAEVVPAFDSIPWLNSSLFEPTELEDETIFVSNLKDANRLPIFSSTVLKDEKGKKRTGELRALEYLFAFLDAYDFSAEGSGEIQNEKKSLISASVLGLIFEKINGYKDGSYFTPGFVTMYMCRETVRRAVVQKFNERKGWNCKEFDELYNKIEDIREANEIVNSLKICDPAVGSGHFLVSALNEIIAVKNDLKILQDRDGKRLKEYHAEVVNDEITVTDEDGKFFHYSPRSRESQRVQEALFHEKQTIIENCLFGVDINPNSVKICRLRLWIELLKNAYYKEDGELETLPNIDINIRCGNSLISRFALDTDVKQVLKNGRWTVDAYRIAVQTYRQSRSSEEKRDLEKLMYDIKKDFRSELGANNPKEKSLARLSGELHDLLNQNHLFEQTAKEKKAREQKQKKLEAEISRLSAEVKEMQSGRIYRNAFEWRFEFPEVLNDDGDFVGFDMVIGNPPYKMIQPNNTSSNEIQYMKTSYPFADFKIDLFHLFFQKGSFLLKNKGFLCYISPSTLLNNVYAEGLRRMIAENHEIYKIAAAKEKIFDAADVHTAIFLLKKESVKDSAHTVGTTAELEEVIAGNAKYNEIKQKNFQCLPGSVWNLLIDEKNFPIINKMAENKNLDMLSRINRGLVTGNRAEYFSQTKISENHIPVLTGSDILRYAYHNPREFVLFERPETAGGCWDKEVHLSSYKICIRQIGTEPTATLVDKPYAVTGNIFTVTDRDLDNLKYWLAIINSSLLKYYWQIMFSDFKTIFPQVTIFSLKQIPIAEKKGKTALKTVSIVSRILAAKKKNPNADTTDLEREIDRLVYDLYGLTEEEIAIVEGRTEKQ
ncbi:MAG: TaqI-like C-terminal specificity domain-containing protein [Desulfococcaceae bacterium]